MQWDSRCAKSLKVEVERGVPARRRQEVMRSMRADEGRITGTDAQVIHLHPFASAHPDVFSDVGRYCSSNPPMFSLARPLFARMGAPRPFSTTAVAQLLKSHSGAKKRFRLTGGGVVSCERVCASVGATDGQSDGSTSAYVSSRRCLARASILVRVRCHPFPRSAPSSGACQSWALSSGRVTASRRWIRAQSARPTSGLPPVIC